MSKVGIVTDSTANLHPEVIERFNIHIIPLKLHWETESFLDGVDISPTEFYVKLAKEPHLPTTSQPSVQDFIQLFDEMVPYCNGIVVPLISSGISGTVASAQSAAAEFTKVPVRVVDTRITSAGQALVVMAAARAADRGADINEVAQIAREISDKIHTFFAVDTLEYLHKGGRIGGATRYLGTALKIKPILTFTDEGKIDALERVRTNHKAHERLIELIKKNSDSSPLKVGVMHASAPQEAADIQTIISQNFDCEEIDIYELSPVIGTHVGPGTIGVSFYSTSKQ
ncbi:MAG TPA: DegV family protein [Anaerolineae bacterium]|nr:DegV family protein [Anaerolineae bacterium]